jgi:hypothetical protein
MATALGRLMAVVAVAGVLIAATLTAVKYLRWRGRLPALDDAARFHRLHEQATAIQARDKRTGRPVDVEVLARLRRSWAAHHAALRRRSESTPTHPWGPLPSRDPPHPIFDGEPNVSIDLHDHDPP